jgi:PP-loop superfamily ATP-utilizing enzyme
LSEAIRNGGLTASVPCAVEVATAEVPLLSPQLLRKPAVKAAPHNINHLVIDIPQMKQSVHSVPFCF